MASFSSVQIKGTTENSSTSACGIYWEEISTNVAANTSVVKAYFCVKNKYSSDSIKDSGCSFTININGVKKSSGVKAVTVPVNSNWYVVFESDEVTVAHNADGSKTIAIKASGEFPNTSPGSIRASGEAILTTIPRASSINAIANSTIEIDGENAISLGIIRRSEDFTHTVVYSLGDLVERHEGVETSDSFVIPLGWRQTGILQNAVVATGKITLTTFNGDEQIGTPLTTTFTAKVPDSVKPTLTASEVSILAVQPTGFLATVYAENRTRMKVQFADNSEVPIVSRVVQLNGITYSTPQTSVTTKEVTGGSENGSTVTMKCRVLDSRGRYSDWYEYDAIVYLYATPGVIETSVFRCNADMAASDNGAYVSIKASYRLSTMGGSNTLRFFKARLRAVTDAPGEWSYTLTPGTALRVGGSLSAKQTYEVQIKVEDAAGGSHALSFVIPTAAVSFNLKDGGKGAAFGKFAEQDELLDSAWPIKAPSMELATPLAMKDGGTGESTAAKALAALGGAPVSHTHKTLVNNGSENSGYTQILFDDQANVLGMMVQGQYSASDETTVRLSLRVNKETGTLVARIDSKAGTKYPTLYTSANPPALEDCNGVLPTGKGGTNATTPSAALTELGFRRGKLANIDVAAGSVATLDVVFGSELSIAPIVVLTVVGEHTNTKFGRVLYEVTSVTTKGFTARVINPTDSAFNVVLNYIAIIP